MAKFKIGDKVKVKSWEDICKITVEVTNGARRIDPFSNSFVKDMRDMCGKTVEIVNAYLSPMWGETYRIKNYDYRWHNWMFEDTFTNSIHIYTDGTTTTAILKDGKKTVKTAHAKCSPDDTYDFNIGAKIAFDRLMGIEEKPAREVKRKAKVGEWVKVTKTEGHSLNKNSIAKVNIVYFDGWVEVVVCSKYDVLRSDEYVVLENYNPEKPIEDKPEFIPHLFCTKCNSAIGNIGEETAAIDKLDSRINIGDVVFLTNKNEIRVVRKDSCCRIEKAFAKDLIIVKKYNEVANGEVIDGVKFVKEIND